MVRRSVILNSLQETASLAKDLSKQIRSGDILCFFGDLGAGKTTLIKSLISTLTSTALHEITSPTFNYCHTYKNIHHFDLYRLQSSKQFFELGFDEYLNADSICLIEWSERIQDSIPAHAWKIYIEVLGETKRKLTYEAHTLSDSRI